MSLVKINDELNIIITNDDEFKKAMDLFIAYKNAKSSSDDEEDLVNEMKLMDLENALKLYKGDYFIVE
ncbi:hypothetical protein AYO37_00705 [Opitutia bacterium SCGC AG-212-L18]|nr:hypothetical protein AYO37_00705 [Opitutae bacterium SCGC AG-212-L18]